MGKAKGKKIQIVSGKNKYEHTMKMVTSDVCEGCRKCERGLRYLEHMSVPGAIGYGVPCILTKGKP